MPSRQDGIENLDKVYTLTTNPFFHTFGHLLVSQSLLKQLVSLLVVSSTSALNTSGHTSSTPAAFLGFVLFNASLNSCNRHLPSSISSIYSDSTISSSSKGFVGSSLFNISLKCSTHICSLSRVSVLSTPCLSFTPISRFRLSPFIDLVMLYSSLFLPFSAAFSAVAALFSNQFLLSSLALRFTSLFFALYSSLHLCFSRSSLHLCFSRSDHLAMSILPLSSRLIFSHVFFPYPWLTKFFDILKTFFAVYLCMLPKSYRVLPPNHLSLLKRQTYSSPQRKTKNYLEKDSGERAKHSWVEELGSSQSGCTRKKVQVKQRGGLMRLLAR